MMEESFLQAQKELFAMAKMAELKAADLPKMKDTGDLDNMFVALANDSNTPQNSEYAKRVGSELDSMFTGDTPAQPEMAGQRRPRRKRKKKE